MLTKDNVAIGIEWRFGPDWPGQRCGANTRRGTACQRPANKKNGRCRLHGGASTGPRTAEGRSRIAAAQYKHGRRSKAFVAAQRARNAKGKAIKRELKSIETQLVFDGLLPKRWERAFRLE
ncbi:hypothetical protein N9D90_00505 [Alphaproteobacteria bacterium]|nr:hypothetical protein [Alphaproteobacteria bacterium]